MVPGKDAVPGTPGQPYIAPTYKTIIVTPAVPATYVQEWLYIQHETGALKWEPEGWNGIVRGVDHGKGWAYVVPYTHRDTNVILTPAVPAVTKLVIDNPGQPYIAPTPGSPAVPPKWNTVWVWIDGTLVDTQSFSSTFDKNYLLGDPTDSHSYVVKARAWNSEVSQTWSGESKPCRHEIEHVTPPGAANPPTCTADGSLPALPTADGYTFSWNRPFNGPGTYYATATAKPGFFFDEDTQTIFTVVVMAKLTGLQCATVVTPVAPTLVTTSGCGTYGSVTPAMTTGVAYAVTFDKVTGNYTVVATPASAAYKFTGAQTVTFTGSVGAFTVCPAVVVTVTSPPVTVNVTTPPVTVMVPAAAPAAAPVLAQTGTNLAWPAGAAAFLMFGGLTTVLMARHRSSRKS